MLKLETRDELQRLVDEGLEESLVLEYKASAALSRESAAVNELCKDVSALANAAGGQIIYGIEEDKATRKPLRIDKGVEDPKITREWIDQIVNSRVQPRMDGVRIQRIPLEGDRFGYVVAVPATQTGPHQAPDSKYYKRFELRAVQMQDYEIRDVMRRSTRPQPFVTLSFKDGAALAKLEYAPKQEVSSPIPILAQISNRSSEPALYTQVSIGVDADFVLTHAGTYEAAGMRETDGTKFNMLRQRWAVSQRLPIFKEAIFDLAEIPFCIAVSSQYLHGSTRFFVLVDVQTPGFSSCEMWHLICENASLQILPPRNWSLGTGAMADFG